ncbi:MAG: hypothetical protein JW725_00340 [Candidatus Babeliaceae bacterium]|nr:hypothetical protein [Candidatus Babeliaceae bacterium]
MIKTEKSTGNPYILGRPLEPEEFQGQTKTLNKVKRDIVDRHNVVLSGPRRIGKTSFLKSLSALLMNEGMYCTIINIRDLASYPDEYIPAYIAEAIRAAFFPGIALQLPKDLPPEKIMPHLKDVFWPQIEEAMDSASQLVLLLDDFDAFYTPPCQNKDYIAEYFETLKNIDETRIRCVFVIDGSYDDLKQMPPFERVFIGAESTKLKNLTNKEVETIINWSNPSGLLWDEEAIEYIFEQTKGYPYLVQAICKPIWDNLAPPSPDIQETVTIDNVQTMIETFPERMSSVLAWLWEGLNPISKYIILKWTETGKWAEVDQNTMTKYIIESGLSTSDYYKELDSLVSNNVLLRHKDQGYKYSLTNPLLALWATKEYTIENIIGLPHAQAFYQAALPLFQQNLLDDAFENIKKSLAVSPTQNARLLAGCILLRQGKPREAVKCLEQAYQYEEKSAGELYTRALMTLAGATEDKNDRLNWLETVLNINVHPHHFEAYKQACVIFRDRGDQALKKQEFKTAVEFYQRLPVSDQVEIFGQLATADYREGAGKTHNKQWCYEFVLKAASKKTNFRDITPKNLEYIQLSAREKIAQIETHELQADDEEWLLTVFEIYEHLVEESPDSDDLSDQLHRIQTQQTWLANYQRAKSILESGIDSIDDDLDSANQLLCDIVRECPAYKNTLELLLRANKGLDLDLLERKQRLLEQRLAELTPGVLWNTQIRDVGFPTKLTAPLTSAGIQTIGSLLDRVINQKLPESVLQQDVINYLFLRGYLLVLNWVDPRDETDQLINDTIEKLEKLRDTESENNRINGILRKLRRKIIDAQDKGIADQSEYLEQLLRIADSR